VQVLLLGFGLLSVKRMNSRALAMLATLKDTTETSGQSVVNVRSQLSRQSPADHSSYISAMFPSQHLERHTPWG